MCGVCMWVIDRPVIGLEQHPQPQPAVHKGRSEAPRSLERPASLAAISRSSSSPPQPLRAAAPAAAAPAAAPTLAPCRRPFAAHMHQQRQRHHRLSTSSQPTAAIPPSGCQHSQRIRSIDVWLPRPPRMRPPNPYSPPPPLPHRSPLLAGLAFLRRRPFVLTANASHKAPLRTPSPRPPSIQTPWIVPVTQWGRPAQEGKAHACRFKGEGRGRKKG